MSTATANDTLDVLLINPRDMVGAFPYVKLAGYAGVLRDAGMKIDMLDPAASKISLKKILDIIGERQPKIICLSAFPSTLPDAYQTVCAIRERFPNKPIILEGYHVNADPTIILDMNVDYGLVGDAEYTCLELCRALLRGDEVDESAAGLAVNANGTLHYTRPAVINKVNELPMPAYDLMPIGKFYSASTTKPFMCLFTTRGCPYDCNFCAFAEQRNYRYFTVDTAMQHIRRLVADLGVGWIEFMDLTFTISKPRTLELCKAMEESGLNFDWGCETRADLIDEELVVAMKRAGCKKITFGVEAGNEEVRYRTGKKITNDAFLEAFDICRKHKLKTMANFIIGHPGETKEQVEESIAFAKALKPFNVFFTRMTPLPDVEIFSEGVKKGEIPADIWVQYMKGEAEHPVYVTPTLTAKELERLYNRAFAKYYFSFHALRNYLPLFTNMRFLVRSAHIFRRIAFGSPIFK